MPRRADRRARLLDEQVVVVQADGLGAHQLRGRLPQPRAADDLLVLAHPRPVAEVLEEAPRAGLAAALDRALAGRGQVALDAVLQARDLGLGEQAAHHARAVAPEVVPETLGERHRHGPHASERRAPCRRPPGSRRARASRRRPGCRRASVPSSAATRSARPRSPEPAARVGAAHAVVGDVDRHAAVDAPHGDASPPSPARTWRRSPAPRRRRSRRRSRPAPGRRSPPSASSVTGTGARAASASSAGSSPCSVSSARVDAAGELAQLGEARAWSSACARSSSVRDLGVGRVSAPAGVAEQEREPDEPRLRAVVQVALEAPALGVAGLDEPRARGAQLLQPGAQLGVEPRDVAAQQPGQEREGQQRRWRRTRPTARRRPRPAVRDGDEQERRAAPHDVDGRELEALERRRAPPAEREPDEHDDEEHRVEQRHERRARRVARSGSWSDEQHVRPGSRRSRGRAARRRASPGSDATVKIR